MLCSYVCRYINRYRLVILIHKNIAKIVLGKLKTLNICSIKIYFYSIRNATTEMRCKIVNSLQKAL